MENKYEEQLKAEWEKFSKSEFLPNIMLLGATGCGKSSLVNLVFGKDIAPVNDVFRGTDGFETYLGSEHNIGVNLIDSRGYELENGSGDSFANYLKSIKEKMEESRNSDPKGKIHIIWFCISVAVGVIQNYDIEVLKLLRNDPELKDRVAVVLTKCDEDDESGNTALVLRNNIANEIGRKVSVFEVSTDEDLINELDLEKLINWSAEQLDDEDMKDAFIASQIISLKAKRKKAAAAIAGYSAGAAAIVIAPVKLKDAVMLTTLQVTMSTHIVSIYGLESLANISKELIGSVLISNIGKFIAGELAGLIPVVGKVINTSVAVAITSSLGFAISEICYDCCKKLARGENVDFGLAFSPETIQNFFQMFMDSKKDSIEE